MKKLIEFLKILLLIAIIIILGSVFFFGHRDIPLKELKSKYANSASSFISVDGMDVHYRDEGLQNGSIPIVLLHGTAASLHTFDVWTDSLKQNHRVIRMDLPAFGLTGPFPDRDYSIVHYTSFLKEFLIALDIEKCVLAGNSLGGQIVWNYTLVQPDMVQKLILIDAAGYPKISKSIPIAFKLAKIPVLNKLMTFITPRFMIRVSIEDVFFDKSKVTDSLVDRYFDLTLRAGNRKAVVDRFSSAADTNYINLKNIKQPTLILWGAQDYLIPVEHAYNFQKDIENATLVILENAGHTPMEESPLESLEPVMKFIGKE